MTTTARTAAPDAIWRRLRAPIVGPLAALVAAVVLFSVTTDTFLEPGNLSLILQQSLVIGTLALGQTLIILTAGIDLANGTIAVLGTIVIAKHVAQGGNPAVGLLLGLLLCTLLGAVSGTLVTWLRLPAFIVTLGVLTVVYATSRLYSGSRSYPVTDDLLGLLGKGRNVGGAFITYGTFLM